MNVSVIAASVFAVMEIIVVANAQPAIQRDALPASGASAYPPQQQEGAAQLPGDASPNAFPPPAGQPGGYAALPPDYQPEVGKPKELPPRLRRQLIDFSTEEPAGTLIGAWRGQGAALRHRRRSRRVHLERSRVRYRGKSTPSRYATR